MKHLCRGPWTFHTCATQWDDRLGSERGKRKRERGRGRDRDKVVPGGYPHVQLMAHHKNPRQSSGDNIKLLNINFRNEARSRCSVVDAEVVAGFGLFMHVIFQQFIIGSLKLLRWHKSGQRPRRPIKGCGNPSHFSPLSSLLLNLLSTKLSSGFFIGGWGERSCSPINFSASNCLASLELRLGFVAEYPPTPSLSPCGTALAS